SPDRRGGCGGGPPGARRCPRAPACGPPPPAEAEAPAPAAGRRARAGVRIAGKNEAAGRPIRCACLAGRAPGLFRLYSTERKIVIVTGRALHLVNRGARETSRSFSDGALLARVLRRGRIGT